MLMKVSNQALAFAGALMISATVAFAGSPSYAQDPGSGTAKKKKDSTPASTVQAIPNRPKTERTVAQVAAAPQEPDADGGAYAERMRQGYTALIQERFEAAPTHFFAALDIRVDDPAARVGVARAYIGMRQFERALGMLESVARMSSKHAETHFFIGDARRGLGQQSLALESYKRYLELAGDTELRANAESIVQFFEGGRPQTPTQ